jgi:hypothetical protein
MWGGEQKISGGGRRLGARNLSNVGYCTILLANVSEIF